MVLLSFPRVFRFSEVAGPEKAKNLAGQSSPPDSDPLTMPSLKENDLGLSREFLASTNCTSGLPGGQPSWLWSRRGLHQRWIGFSDLSAGVEDDANNRRRR